VTTLSQSPIVVVSSFSSPMSGNDVGDRSDVTSDSVCLDEDVSDTSTSSPGLGIGALKDLDEDFFFCLGNFVISKGLWRPKSI